MNPIKTKNAVTTPSLDELRHAKKKSYEFGRSLRKQCPRKAHAINSIPDRDPVTIHKNTETGRIEDLLAIRYERLLESPFAHFRGAAAIMASDLSKLPSTDYKIQICGDSHLLNFGGFATPERNIIFDINDFDETSIAPWEWDVKRLAASVTIAASAKGYSKAYGRQIAKVVVSTYTKKMRKYAKMSALQIWYEDISFENMVQSESDDLMRKLDSKRLEKASERTPHEKEFQKMTEEIDGKVKIKDNPPLMYHVDESKQKAFMEQAENAFSRYLESLSNDRRTLLENYTIHDAAMKVVGVGSVGTWCGIFLLLSEHGDPLFLQFKEAYQSVFEPFTGASPYEHPGQRVVEGQKLMQSASDIFLGWTTDDSGREYYIRQMRDAKIKPVIELMDEKSLLHYAASCAWALAQAHARTGSAAVISGYIGKSDKFKNAIAVFALAYEKQNNKDYKLLKLALQNGK